jgi:flagellar hook-length control protein FliK
MLPQDKSPSATKNGSDSTQTSAAFSTGLAEGALATTTQTMTQTTPTPSKQDLSGTEQSQIFAAQGNLSGSTASPSTSAPVFVSGAALAAGIDHNSGNAGSNAGSDLLSNSQNSASQTSLGSNAAAMAEGAQATGTYNFASTLSALRATNGGSVGLPSVVDQVILQMNRSVKSGNDQMTLQLNPADLGKITVKLDFGSDGKVQGTVTADNPQTLSMLQKDSRSLERALQDAGLRADPGSLQFSLGGGEGNGGNQAGQTANNGGSNQDTAAGDGTIPAGDSAGLIDIGANAETYYLTPGGVNIQV